MDIKGLDYIKIDNTSRFDIKDEENENVTGQSSVKKKIISSSKLRSKKQSKNTL
jgi:hypothetical protein